MKPPKVTALTGKKMSVAIGSRYEWGTIICSDTKVVLSDGSTTLGSKLSVMCCAAGTFAIANSSTIDGSSGTALAEEIMNDICNLKGGGSQPFVEAIKDRMRRWHAGYGSPAEKPPSTQFLIGGESRGYGGLWFCEPPQTVICEYDAVTIGAGAATVEPLLPMVLTGRGPLKPTILKLIYLMHRAKKEQGAYVGGPTEMIVIRASDRDQRIIAPREMDAAERAIQAVDAVLRDCCAGLFCCQSDEDQRESLTKFTEFFMRKSATFRDIRFPSLDGFEDPKQ